MRAIMVMFDSLNRRMLSPYGCEWTHTPNFQRLAERTVQFDNCYVGSMPCMPARRELHTGRYDFLHRDWGPLEPFDDSMPEILDRNGVHTHLATDHYHYYQDGGANYHCRYSTWEFFRGREGDPWKGNLKDSIPIAPNLNDRDPKWWRQEYVNRSYMPEVDDHNQTKTFNAGLEFIRTNADCDNWFLHLETFDPHEPFFSHAEFKELYKHDYLGPECDWPNYGRVSNETPEMIQHLRYEYAALLSMCDRSLGRVLDLMDELNLWEDTLLIVNTDHGFFLGEKGWLAKVIMPFYNEVAHIPLFVWDPRCGKKGETRKSLVQTVDLAPTLLDYFGQTVDPTMNGKSLTETILNDRPVRQAGLFGAYGGHVSFTDGRYVYMRAAADGSNEPLSNHTLIPAKLGEREPVHLLRSAEWAGPFSFTKGCRVMKYPKPTRFETEEFGHLLFDLEKDPDQKNPIVDPELEKRMIDRLISLMREAESPEEQFRRLGLENVGS
ncbi:MAG: sulfatase [Candidatus Omnitrophica bacterium]|nr:sulfatase [Candidatus Omnitrophota bacterium]